MARETIITALMLFTLTLPGCVQNDASKKDDISLRKIKIVATTGMVGDLARNIGGERVELTVLMGPGIDPHLYKASERDVIRMSEADIILFNGMHLEGAMAEVLEKLKGRIKTRAVAGSLDERILLTPKGFKSVHDPHIWFDVSLWMKAGENVADLLASIDTINGDTYWNNTESYMAELQNLHDYVMEQANRIPENQKVLITAHDAFNYFGRAYGFEVRGLQGISTASEAGTADVQELAAFIAKQKIPAMFVETSVPQRNIEAVQAAVRAKGFEVKIGGELFSDAMGSPGTPEGDYIGMIKHNIDTIVKALLGE